MTELAAIERPAIAELLLYAQQQLSGIETAMLDAEILLCHAASITRSSLHAHPDMILPDNTVHQFQNLIELRHTGTPVAYLIGHKEFWSMDFKVNELTLIPRPETECLVEMALAHIPVNKQSNIADLGTGCGNIAISIARERPACHITATDISFDALKIAETNAKSHAITNITFQQSDWFETVTENFDMIVSNPPYIEEDDEHLLQADVQYEPRLALVSGIDGLDSIKNIITGSKNHLHNDGFLMLEHGFDQGSKVRKLLSDYGYVDCNTLKDYSGHERVSFGIFRN